MKAVVKTQPAENSAEVISWPEPVLRAPNELIVAVECAAVCGSDLHAYEYPPNYRWMKVPVVLGHEFCGKVVEAGPEARYQVGDRVMGESNQPCGYCANCRQGQTHICLNSKMRGLSIDGVMADYVRIEDKFLHRVPESLSSAEAAAAQACTVSAHAIFDRSEMRPNSVALVIGPGIVGLSAAQLAVLKGAVRVVVTGRESDAPKRLKLAEQLGFATINVDKADLHSTFRDITGGRPADIVIECSGSPRAVQSALPLMRKGGELLFLGLLPTMEFPFSDAIRNEWRLTTSYTSGWKNYEDTLALIDQKKLVIGPLLEMYALEDALQAFNDALQQKVAKPVFAIG